MGNNCSNKLINTDSEVTPCEAVSREDKAPLHSFHETKNYLQSLPKPHPADNTIKTLNLQIQLKDKEIELLKQQLINMSFSKQPDPPDFQPPEKTPTRIFRRNYTNGDVYEGDLDSEKMHGYGKYTWRDGDFYEGEWLNGKKSGKGVFRWSDGRVFEGDWKNGLAHGLGKCTWPSGDVYDGEWKCGKRNGFGKAMWADGRVYEGMWKDGEKHGKGKMVQSGRKEKEGVWEYDVYIGKDVGSKTRTSSFW